MILLKVIEIKNAWFATTGFFNQGFTFQVFICNGCHILRLLCLNISDTAIITVKNVDYRCIINNISKTEAINLLENSVLEDRGFI